MTSAFDSEAAVKWGLATLPHDFDPNITSIDNKSLERLNLRRRSSRSRYQLRGLATLPHDFYPNITSINNRSLERLNLQRRSSRSRYQLLNLPLRLFKTEYYWSATKH